MKVTFPHMGTAAIGMKAFLEGVGLEVIPPPPTSKRTLQLGSRYAPEFACLPLKINLGNFLEALELGADTIIMAGGVGPCRFGYYGEVQREILRTLDHKCNFLTFEPPGGDLKSLLRTLQQLLVGVRPQQILKAGRLSWAKLWAVDEIWQQSLWARPREEKEGATTVHLRKVLAELDRAKTPREVGELVRKGKAEFAAFARRKPKLQIALVGEIYVLLDPFTNQELEEKLGLMGVEVHRTIYLSQWLKRHLFWDFFQLQPEGSSPRLARGYLNHRVGGHGLETIANTVLAAQRCFDGVIHLAPFTCMPEIVAASILPQVSKNEEIPVLTLILDEHTAEAGLVTRLEAFVDMLLRKGERGRTANGLLSWA